MKIALCGASGTGKTTLANKLAIHFNLPVEQYEHPDGSGRMTSLSRALAYDMVGVDTPYTVDKQGLRRPFQWEGIKRKRDWELAHYTPGYVTDRTHLDWYTYAVLHDIELATDECFQASCFEYSMAYDAIVLCTMQRFFKLGDDAARKSSVIYQELYENNLLGAVAKLAARGVGSVRVIVPTQADTFADILQKLEGPV